MPPLLRVPWGAGYKQSWADAALTTTSPGSPTELFSGTPTSGTRCQSLGLPRCVHRRAENAAVATVAMMLVTAMANVTLTVRGEAATTGLLTITLEGDSPRPRQMRRCGSIVRCWLLLAPTGNSMPQPPKYRGCGNSVRRGTGRAWRDRVSCHPPLDHDRTLGQHVGHVLVPWASNGVHVYNTRPQPRLDGGSAPSLGGLASGGASERGGGSLGPGRRDQRWRGGGHHRPRRNISAVVLEGLGSEGIGLQPSGGTAY